MVQGSLRVAKLNEVGLRMVQGVQGKSKWVQHGLMRGLMGCKGAQSETNGDQEGLTGFT